MHIRAIRLKKRAKYWQLCSKARRFILARKYSENAENTSLEALEFKHFQGLGSIPQSTRNKRLPRCNTSSLTPTPNSFDLATSQVTGTAEQLLRLGAPLVPQYWGGGGGGTRHFFLLTLYNFKNIGRARATSPPPPPTSRSLGETAGVTFADFFLTF